MGFKSAKRSPFVIARKHLEPAIKNIFKILELCVKNNSVTSAYLLDSDEFLKAQLKTYPDLVSNLLKETIRCSEYLRENDENGEQINDWIKCLETVTEKNIDEQTLYIEIISLALVDIRGEGITTYQNKCLSEMFSSNGPNTHRGLISFGSREGEPVITFKKDTTLDDFLNNNKSLEGLLLHGEEDLATLKLTALTSMKTEIPALNDYINYIGACLKLLANLCRSRNSKSKKLESLNITYQYIVDCLNKPGVDIRFKNGFLEIYEHFYLNCDPYTSISEYSNRCIVVNLIEKYNFEEATFKIINRETLDVPKNIEDVWERISQFITKFWKSPPEELRIKNNKEFARQMTRKKKKVKDPLIFSEEEEKTNYQLQYFLKMLQLSKTVLDLGYTDKNLNYLILLVVAQIFSKFEQKNSLFDDDSRFWIKSFFKTAEQLISNSESNKYILGIVDEAACILKIFTSIRTNIQILAFMKEVMKEFDQMKITTDKDDREIFNYLLRIYDLNLGKSLVDPRAENDFKDIHKDSRASTWRSILGDPSAKTDDINESNAHIGVLLLNSLLCKGGIKNSKTKGYILEVLIDYFNQRSKLLGQLNQVELIDTKKEVEIYRELVGNDLSGQVLTPSRLDLQIKKVLNEDPRYKTNKIQYEEKKQVGILELNNVINKIIKKFKERSNEEKLFSKMQNILRNLGVHEYIKRILRLKYAKEDHEELFSNVMNFFSFFTKGNTINQQQLLNFFPEFLNLAEKRIKVSETLAYLLSNIKEDQMIHSYVDRLFEKLNNTERNDFANREIVIILRSLLKNKMQKVISENQKKILARFLKTKSLLDFTDPQIKSYTEYIKTIMDDHGKNRHHQQEKYVSDKLMLHMDVIMLFGNITVDFKLGVLQLQKILVFEQIKNLLNSNQTPLLLKKSYLRCLFQIYICQPEQDLNVNFTPADMCDILSSVVIPDFSLYHKYLEGIIKLKSKNPQELERLKNIRIKIASNKLQYAPESANTDEKNLSSKKNQTQGHYSQASAANRYILSDISEYWEYLESGKPWDCSKDGLLHFMLDCFYEIKRRKWLSEESDDNFSELLGQVKTALDNMKQALARMEKDLTLDFSKYNLLINECINQVPVLKFSKAGKHFKITNEGRSKIDKTYLEDSKNNTSDNLINIKQKEVPSAFLKKIEQFLLRKRINVDGLYEMLETTDDTISKDTFIDKLFSIMNTKNINSNINNSNDSEAPLKKEEILEFVEKFTMASKKKNKEELNLKKIIEKLRKTFEKSRPIYNKDIFKKDKNERIIPDEDDLTQSKSITLMKFMNNFFRICIANKKRTDNSEAVSRKSEAVESGSYENGNSELAGIADRLREDWSVNYKPNSQELVEKITKLTSIFSGKNSLYVIKILKTILKFYNPKNNSNTNKKENSTTLGKDSQGSSNNANQKNFKFLQDIYDDAKVVSLAMSYIKPESKINYVNESIKLLNSVLLLGNFKVQNSILNMLKNDPNGVSFSFFSYFRDSLKKLPLEAANSGKTDYIYMFDMTTCERKIRSNKLLRRLLRFLQLVCENCNNDFQNFLRKQDYFDTKTTGVSVNLIIETSNLLSSLNIKDEETIGQSFETLTDFCMGPCRENQNMLCNDKRLINFINEKVLKIKTNFDSETDFDISPCIKFLLSITIGNTSPQNLRNTMNLLDLQQLLKKMQKIYDQKISFRHNIIFQDRRCEHIEKCGSTTCVNHYLKNHDLNLIKTGFDLFILLIHFSEIDNYNTHLKAFFNPEEYNKKRLSFLKEKFHQDTKRVHPNRVSSKTQLINDETSSISSNIENDRKELINKLANEDKKGKAKKLNSQENEALMRVELDDLLEKERIFNCYTFYRGLIGTVEINKNNEISKIFFQKPFLSKFLTENIKQHIIYQANRESDQERIEHLFYNIERYKLEMRHRQKLSRYKVIYYLLRKWRVFKDLSLVLIIVINLFLIISYINVGGQTIRRFGDLFDYFNTVITTIQLLISCGVLILCTLERYPISIKASYTRNSEIKKKKLKTDAGLLFTQKNLIYRYLDYLNSLIDELMNKLNKRFQFYKCLFDYENIYNAIYLGLTLGSYFYPWIYSFLLLDVIKRSADLQNIMKAITTNYNTLIKTMILGLIIMYIYSYIGFLVFNEYYKKPLYANTFVHAFATTIDNGLRNGGGIGDAVPDPPTITDDLYWYYYIFELTFFIIINILFINIIFGIIIDTFGQLRDDRSNLIEDIKEKCYICGIKQFQFDTKGTGWLEHIYLDHNVYHYLDFLIYIENKDINECNGIEKYVKEMYDRKLTEFFPIQKAKALENKIE